MEKGKYSRGQQIAIIEKNNTISCLYFNELKLNESSAFISLVVSDDFLTARILNS